MTMAEVRLLVSEVLRTSGQPYLEPDAKGWTRPIVSEVLKSVLIEPDVFG